MMQPDCADCCFFHLVETKGRRQRRLCMLTGELKLYAGMHGCQFMPGTWAEIDKADDCGNSGVPNQMKPGNGFSRNGRIIASTKIAIDDFSASPISHIAAKAERRFTDPVPVRAGGSFGRGVCKSPFAF